MSIVVAVLITCFNRKETTIKSLESFYRSSSRISNIQFDVFLVDDNSTDGTYDAIKHQYPKIILIKGNGNLYWGGGMNLAWKTALTYKDYDGFIWYNDDVLLYEDAFELILSPFIKGNKSSIISGAFCSSYGTATYGGKMEETSPFLIPNNTYQPLRYLNGNLVFIPSIITKKVGLIDQSFKHGLGDNDYGFRALNSGFKLLLTPKYVGVCERHDNDIPKCYRVDYSVFKRLSCLYSPFYNPNSYFIFNNRYYGLLLALKRYILTLFQTLFPKIYNCLRNIVR